MRKPRLTIAEHVALGAELAAMYDQLQTTAIRVSGYYPKNDPVWNYAWRAMHALRDWRNELDKAAFREHGDAIPVSAYFGANTPERIQRAS
jgi:hypothetical protein